MKSRSSHSLGGRGEGAQERLNKFPLSCMCYSRAENGCSSGAWGQGQSGAAATRRAESARWVQEYMILPGRDRERRCVLLRSIESRRSAYSSLQVASQTTPRPSHLQLWENWLDRQTTYGPGIESARSATHGNLTGVHRAPRAGFRSRGLTRR